MLEPIPMSIRPTTILCGPETKSCQVRRQSAYTKDRLVDVRSTEIHASVRLTDEPTKTNTEIQDNNSTFKNKNKCTLTHDETHSVWQYFTDEWLPLTEPADTPQSHITNPLRVKHNVATLH